MRNLATEPLKLDWTLYKEKLIHSESEKKIIVPVMQIVSILMVTLLILPSICQNMNYEEGDQALFREPKQLGYPTSYLQYAPVSQRQPTGDLSLLYTYKRPSLTSRVRNFMSSLFFGRSRSYQSHYQPHTSLIYLPLYQGSQTNGKPVYITPSTKKQIRVSTYETPKYHYKLVNNIDSYQVPQNDRYVLPLLSKNSGATYETNSYDPNIFSASDNNQLRYASFNSPAYTSSDSVSYVSISDSSGSEEPVDKNTLSSQTENGYTSLHQATSSGFQPILSPSLSNHSPVYRSPSVYEKNTKSTGSHVYENS
ncbi:uncharacterized protein LOC143255124 [Tachypleus tridentatus]|uniref:uncharacterized protein LOC143255124 n=1 Tax=Tachypleus tridentatus TaxID=6853 RepID=UPI003FD1424B